MVLRDSAGALLRDSAGVVLPPLYRIDQTGVETGLSVVAELDPATGLPTGNMIATSSATFDHTGSAVLSFEQDSGGVARVRSVTVNGTPTVADATWTGPALTVSQNILSGAVPVDGLTVSRMFYTQPNQLWARWTDTFTNNTGAALTRTVNYDSTLGSDILLGSITPVLVGNGVIYATPGAGGKALTSWDRTGGIDGDRDVGLVFGSGASLPTYTSATATAPGSTDIRVSHTIVVPAGGSVTLVNFVILSGTDTGFGGTTPVTARATAIDAVAADIATNFRSNVIYQRGMTQAQINTLKNF